MIISPKSLQKQAFRLRLSILSNAVCLRLVQQATVKHLPVQVAAKTGTSQEYRNLGGSSVKINNGFLIAFAPYESPEIAVAVVGEGMTSGAFVAPVVADIVEYYYGQSDELDHYQPENVLIP